MTDVSGDASDLPRLGEASRSSTSSARGPSERFRRSLAVVIGIDTYGEGIPPLRSAVSDARAIAETLRRDHGFETVCLFDGEARRSRLLALLQHELSAGLGADDRLLVYFAGHGIAVDGASGPAGYLVPAYARRSHHDDLLAMDVVHAALARLPVRHALVILDCCFAGTFHWSSSRDVATVPVPIYRERYDRYVESPAWQVLTSASGTQLALDGLADTRGELDGGHSPFAAALLDGLAGAADYTQDHLITADELAIYVRERVAPAVEAIGRRQVPQLFPLQRHDGGQFVFQVPNQPLELAAAPALDERANPYRGLRSFCEDDRALFFGRDAATRALLDAVTARRLTIVVGPSGSGKSSLVHAGLLPTLRAHGWTVLETQRPGRRPRAVLDAWQQALDPDARKAGPAAVDGDRQWLLVLDQLEELLTYRTPPAERSALLEGVAHLLATMPAVRIVIIVRSDVEPAFHDTVLRPWWSAALFTVPAMSRGELRQVIEKPATAAVLHFEPSSLVDRLVDDVAMVPAPLPLLSFALSELYRRCWMRWQRGLLDRALRASDYDDLGSVARALTQRATVLHDELVAEQAAYAVTMRNIFTRMTAVIGGELSRRRVSSDELAYDEPDERRRVTEILERFHEARLVSLGTEVTGDGRTAAYAEPTHDELIRGWTKVSAWLDELDASAGTRALRAALSDAVRSWCAHDQRNEYLWNDPRVELVWALARRQPFLLNAGETQFVTRSSRRRRRRRARLIGSMVVVIVVLAVATVVAARQRDAADRASRIAEQKSSEALQRLGASDLERGRMLLTAGRGMEALPYLVAARAESIESPQLRLLFAEASRSMPLVRLVGHTMFVRSVALSPDARSVATASDDSTGRLWDATTGRPLTPPLAHGDAVVTVAFSADGRRVVTASHDRTARVWDARTGQPLTPPLTHDDMVAAAAFSPDGTRVVTASHDRTARVWDAQTGKLLTSLQHRAIVSAAAFSADGTRVVTASHDHTARVWDAATGKAITPWLAHQHIVVAAAFSPDGTRVITASSDNTAQIWNATTGERATPPLRHDRPVTAAAFSPDGQRAVTASADHTARIWDAMTGSALTEPLEHSDTVIAAGFSGDGQRLVTASHDHTVLLWDVETGSPVTVMLEEPDTVIAVAFSSDITRVVTATYDPSPRVWDIRPERPIEPPAGREAEHVAVISPGGTRMLTGDGSLVKVLTVGSSSSVELPVIGPVASATFSPDDTRVATVNQDNTVQLWDTATGRQVRDPLDHVLPASIVVFSRNSTRLLIVSGNQARVWNAMTGTPAGPPVSQGLGIVTAALSPSGARIVSGELDGTVRVWDVAHGKRLTERTHPGRVTVVAFSPDDGRVVSACDDTVFVWNAADGRDTGHPMTHKGQVVSAEFSPNGELVATASLDGTAQIWNAATGEPVVPPLFHRAAVNSAAFSPDGALVVTASADHTAQVWDATTGRQVAIPLEHPDSVVHAEFSRSGTQLITQTWEGSPRMWAVTLDPGSLEDWRQLADCAPFAIRYAGLVANPNLANRCLRVSTSPRVAASAAGAW